LQAVIYLSHYGLFNKQTLQISKFVYRQYIFSESKTFLKQKCKPHLCLKHGFGATVSAVHLSNREMCYLLIGAFSTER
jgi:hypothetical protein